MNTKVFAVIHVKDTEQANHNTHFAKYVGFDGVFLISHGTMDSQHLLNLAKTLQYETSLRHRNEPLFQVGINLLGTSPVEAFIQVGDSLDMLWTDNAFVEDSDHTDTIKLARSSANSHAIYYGGVAFKYQPQPADLRLVAEQARGKVDVLTTSGPGTGIAPELEKLATLAEGFGERIGVASGITPENAAAMVPYVGHMLVATGIGRDFYNLDPIKCKRLLEAVREA
jgi:predicted TIM-barrel enzyme